jgi:hypothetical protein
MVGTYSNTTPNYSTMMDQQIYAGNHAGSSGIIAISRSKADIELLLSWRIQFIQCKGFQGIIY